MIELLRRIAQKKGMTLDELIAHQKHLMNY